MGAESVFRSEIEARFNAGFQSGEQLFELRQQLVCAQLQRGRSSFKGADHRAPVGQSDAVMQGDETVGANTRAHDSFPEVWGCGRNCAHNISATPTVIAESARLNAGQP